MPSPDTPAGFYRWLVKQGDTAVLAATWSANGSPVDLTGCSAKLQVRAGKAAAGADVLLEASTDNGKIVITALTGKIVCTFPAGAVLDQSDWKGAEYDLQITLADGSVRTILEGPFVVSKEVTR